ncbi:MAG: hypothetical protein WCK82_02635 [Bacteroidota bacterium]|jgi:hypothetical protein
MQELQIGVLFRYMLIVFLTFILTAFVIDFQSVVDSFSASTEAVSILFSLIK